MRHKESPMLEPTFYDLAQRYSTVLNSQRGKETRRNQEVVFANIVRATNRLSLSNSIWAYGCISCHPELGSNYDRPHKDLDFLVLGADNVTHLAGEVGLQESPSRLTRGSPLHLFTDPDTGVLVEMRCLEIPDPSIQAYPYTRPLWTRAFMRQTLGMPRSALYDPTSIFEWGGVECQRVHPEYTYMTKCASPATKDLFDAEALRRSGLIDSDRIQRIYREITTSGLNLKVPPIVAHIFRFADRALTTMQTRQTLA